MKLMHARDQLFLNIINDLAADVMSDTAAASEETITLASHFLDSESQKLVDNFHELYESDELDEEKECASNNIDDILEAVEKNTAIPETNACTQKLGAVQEGVQEVIRKDEAVKKEVNVVLGAMQFAEMLRQHLTGITNSFAIVVDSESRKPDELVSSALETMHTYDERKAFHECVLHQPMPEEDAAISQDLIDQLIP